MTEHEIEQARQEVMEIAYEKASEKLDEVIREQIQDLVMFSLAGKETEAGLTRGMRFKYQNDKGHNITVLVVATIDQELADETSKILREAVLKSEFGS